MEFFEYATLLKQGKITLPRWAGLLIPTFFGNSDPRYHDIKAGILTEFNHTLHSPPLIERTHLRFDYERISHYEIVGDRVTRTKYNESIEAISGFELSKIFDDYPSFEKEIRQVVGKNKHLLETFLMDAKRFHDGLELEVRQVAPKP